MSRRREGNLPALMIALIATLHAALNRFVCDDALISFTYAKHYAAGHGLVFHPSLPPVEGYTNALWTWLLGVCAHVADIEASAYALSLLAFFSSCLILHHIASRSCSPRGALLALLTFAFSSTATTFATSGLETSAQVLFTLIAIALAPRRGARAAICLGASLGVALWIRMDAGLLCATIALSFLLERRRLSEILPVLLFPACALACLFGWRLSTYGEWLPNTFYVKAQGDWVRGAAYVSLCGIVYLVPFLVLASDRRALLAQHKIYFAFATVWALYIIRAGGGFMEFRLLAPILPLVALSMGQLYDTDRLKSILWASALVAWGVAAQHVPLKVMDVWSRASMEEFARGQREVGVVLREIDPGGEVLVAEGAVGGVAYESRSPVLDVFGLNDAEIARRAHVAHHSVPGHRVIAPVDHLRARGVHIAKLRLHPVREELLEYLRAQRAASWPDAKVVLAPAHDAGFLYTRPHPVIEGALERGELVMVPAMGPGGGSPARPRPAP